MDKERKDLWIIVIFVIISLYIVLVICCIVKYFVSISKTTYTATQSSFNNLCTADSDCSTGYECDSTLQVCKKSLGTPCESFAECITGTYCSGVCVTGAYGSQGQNCPCLPGYTCSLISDSLQTQCTPTS